MLEVRKRSLITVSKSHQNYSHKETTYIFVLWRQAFHVIETHESVYGMSNEAHNSKIDQLTTLSHLSDQS